MTSTSSLQQSEFASPQRARRHIRLLVLTSNATIGYALLFLLTGLVGVACAYDAGAAAGRWALLAVGILLMGGLAWVGRTHAEAALGLGALVCAFLAGGFSIYFSLVHDWEAASVNGFVLLPEIGKWLQSLRPTLPHLRELNDNLAASCILILLPLGVAGATWAWMRPARIVAAVAYASLALALLGLALTASRGAMFGLVAGVFAAAYGVWRLHGRPSRATHRVGDLVVSVVVAAVLATYLFILAVPTFDERLGIATREVVAGSRVYLWRDTLPLIQDYWFTGSGLDSTAMVYSTYVFLLHVPYLFHAHNLFLQIAAEQGIPGLIFFAGMVGCTMWGLVAAWGRVQPELRPYCAATAAALVALLVHGLFDAEIYVSALALLLFLPFGFALALHMATRNRRLQRGVGASGTAPGSTYRRIAIALAPVLLVMLQFAWPGSYARLQANLAAVAQTKAELSLYHWPEWPIQDALRRSSAADLTAAKGRYQAALVADPNQVTAHARLGQIALSRGDFSLAQQHLEAAYQIAPNRRAVRQLLGEVYAVTGRSREAAALWQTVDTSNGQLEARLWWYQHLGASQEAAKLSEVIEQAQ